MQAQSAPLTFETAVRVGIVKPGRAIAACVKNTAWTDEIPRLVSEGEPTEGPDPEECALLVAFRCRNVKAINMLVELGSDPCKAYSIRKVTIIHVAATTNSIDMLHLAVRLFPDGLQSRSLFGATPLMWAVDIDVVPMVRELIALGAWVNPPLPPYDCNIAFAALTPMDCRIGHDVVAGDTWRYLVAMGARTSGAYWGEDCASRRNVSSCNLSFRTLPVEYLCAVEATEACREAAWVILSLGRVGRARGNGRDALRLVAKEVWLSRMDQGWERAGALAKE